ncbi:hypothetical protein Tco_0842277 [Tanacetum coccineum]|uniref:Uncharacterized protein n=1 Tax=Tanacetum coccineum TaxID=301880 RepID=A0ABQ5AYU3_9ASTR
MGILCSCFRAAEPDDESVDSDDNEQVQGSSNVVNRNAQDNFALFLHNLTNKYDKEREQGMRRYRKVKAHIKPDET